MNAVIVIVVSVASVVGCALCYKLGRHDGVEEARRMMSNYVDSDSMFV